MVGGARRRMNIPPPPTARSDRPRQTGRSSQRVEVPRAAGGSERGSGSSRRGDECEARGELERVSFVEKRHTRSETRTRPRSPEEEEEEVVPPLQRRRISGGPAVVEATVEAIAAIPVSTFSPGGAGVGSVAQGEAAVVEGSTTPTAEGPSSAAATLAFPTGRLGDILGKVERAVKPILKDLSRLRNERAELQKALDVKKGVIEKGRETVKALEEEKQGLLNDRESLVKERDLAVMKFSSMEKELEELKTKVELCESRATSAEVAMVRTNSEKIYAEGELAALRNSYGVLEKNHEELKEALAEARESTRRWLVMYEELKEGEQVNYHGAWNNAILQILRDNPGVSLDLSKLNRYDDWVAYTNRDPLKGRDEEWGRERQVPE